MKILTSHEKGLLPDHVFFVPTICIAEVFGVFAKYRYGKWNPQVKKPKKRMLDDRTFCKIREEFHKAISNGRFLNQVDLSRYHVLATDLVAPIDHHFEHFRSRKKNIQKKPMSTSDHLVVATALHMSRVFGHDSVVLLTADERMRGIVDTKARRIVPKTSVKLKLEETALRLGYTYGPELYPRVVNLARCSTKDLMDIFGQWPLPTRRLANRLAEIGTVVRDDDADMSLATAEKRHILSVFDSTGRNKMRAAKLLDISRTTLRDKLSQYEDL